MKTLKWTGHAWIGAGAALFVGTSGNNQPHRHHAIQLAVGIVGEVGIDTPGSPTLRAHAVLIPADCTHALAPGPVGLLYLEPESQRGNAIAEFSRNSPAVIPNDHAAKLRACITSKQREAPEETVGRLVELVTGSAAPIHAVAKIDPRVSTAKNMIQAHLTAPPQVKDLARAAACSESHLRTLFRCHVGLSIKRYRLWAKLRVAMGAHLNGANLTESAHAAGFADAAHMTRTFRAMFGTSPTNALAELRPFRQS